MQIECGCTGVSYVNATAVYISGKNVTKSYWLHSYINYTLNLTLNK